MNQFILFRIQFRNFCRTILVFLATTVVLFLGCTHNQSTDKNLEATNENIHQINSINRLPTNYIDDNTTASEHDVEVTEYLEQNWKPGMREAFYRTAQGSHIMPLKFALALEQSNKEEKFFTSKNLSKYGYIPQKVNKNTNPYGLPIGFTIDGRVSFSLTSDKQESDPTEVGDKQLGINCAACHTANLRYKNKIIRIDGGQGFTNFQNFVADMDSAIIATSSDKEKMNRLISKVLNRKDNSKNEMELREKIKNEFKKLIQERKEWIKLNASHFQAGPSRVDAFSIIFNQVIARDLGIFENRREPVNPVSYPVIWDGPHHDFVQWNGLASNHPSNGGPLARNSGEVLGVFGRVDLSKTTKFLNGYCSTVRRDGLIAMEDWLRELNSPKWPEHIFLEKESEAERQIRQNKISLGEKVYANNCISCHAVIDSTNPHRQIKAVLTPTADVGTDPQFNNNALSWTAQTGPLKGRLTRLKKGRPLEAVEPAVTVLKHVVAGSMVGTISPLTCTNSMETTAGEIIEKWFQIAKKTISEADKKLPDDDDNESVRLDALKKTLDVYKARPLNGIWSSAPFLHNGSVKNLYELLQPAAKRSPKFIVGCENFDPVNVGVDCKKNEGFVYDTKLNGNLNTGHEYGTDINDDERWALVEYIKKL